MQKRVPDPYRRIALICGALALLVLLFELRPRGLAQVAADRTANWLPLIRQPGEPPAEGPEPTAAGTATAAPVATAAPTATLVPTATASATATLASSPTATASATATATATLVPSPTATATIDPAQPYKVLAFSKTAAYRHTAIPSALEALIALGAANDFTVDNTEDATAFSDTNLAQYRVVVFLMTSGDVLNNEQQAAFERYIRAGGGFVGVHSASDTEYDWPWYGQLVGAYFKNHPPTWRQATMLIEDPNHISTAHLGASWVRRDEWFNFRSNPRDRVHVLITLDESTYTGGEMGADHPYAWCHNFDGGRAWYTGLSHDYRAYATSELRMHLLGGIEYAAGVAGGCPVSNVFDPALVSVR